MKWSTNDQLAPNVAAVDHVGAYTHILQLCLSTRNITNHGNNIYPQKYIIFLIKLELTSSP